MVKRNAIATKLTKICTQTQKRAFDVAVSDQCYGGVGERNNCTKVEGGGVSVNTYYFAILFRRCFATVVNQL